VSVGSVGPVTVGSPSASVSVGGNSGNIGNTGNVSFTSQEIPDFLDSYSAIPASPLPYNGNLKESTYVHDQLWFSRGKWTEDMVNGLPDKGNIRDAVFEKTSPVKYFMVRDGRKNREYCSDQEREVVGKDQEGKDILGACKPFNHKDVKIYDDQGKEKKGSLYFLGPVYCDSAGPDDKPGLVWGGCSRRLLKKSCSYAVLKAALVNEGVKSNATNQGGGVSLGWIFAAITGITGGGGAGNTDHVASSYEYVNMIWHCYGVH